MSRLAVVFGGSRGIGRAVSQLLAQRGHRVVVLSRNKEAAQATAESLPGEKHLGLSCDVSKEENVQKAFETISKTCGTVGYLVNAAGINRDALLLRSKSEDMLSVLHTNLLGSILTCRGALRSMLSHGGAIVNIGEAYFSYLSKHYHLVITCTIIFKISNTRINLAFIHNQATLYKHACAQFCFLYFHHRHSSSLSLPRKHNKHLSKPVSHPKLAKLSLLMLMTYQSPLLISPKKDRVVKRSLRPGLV
uniref:3-ketoacyl-[acyl-carrier-protein] reductase beta subunit n=1 Tax=Sinocyclocheilus rhinocerous TaxID=307959 RepID=A0A673LW82_9TELE